MNSDSIIYLIRLSAILSLYYSFYYNKYIFHIFDLLSDHYYGKY